MSGEASMRGRQFLGIVEMSVGATLLAIVTGASLSFFLFTYIMPGVSIDGVFVTGLGVIAFALIVGAISFLVGARNVMEEAGR